MAVAHDAVSESHTGTSGVANVTSFTWNHVPTGTPRSALVCTLALGANPVTGVTYGGTAMTAMPYTAYDSDTEPGFLQVWFLDNVASGTQAVVVSRTSNSVVTYAVCTTQTVAAGKGAEIYDAGVKTRAASGTQQSAASASGTGVSSSWQTLTGIDDGSPGSNSCRYMFVYSGASSVPTAGTNSTSLSASGYIDFGNYVFQSFVETTPSQGAKDMSVGVAISDDLAVIGLAVREKTLVDNRNYSAVLTGGGVASPAGVHGRSMAATATGGGVAVASPSGAHSVSVLETGGGVTPMSGAHGGLASATGTGGGVATLTGLHAVDRSATATGGGVAVVDGVAGAAIVNIDGTLTATGGGVAAASASHGGLTSVTGTGGGVASLSGLHAVDRSVTGTGGGVAALTPTGAHTASVTGTGGGVATVTYVKVDGGLDKTADLTATGGGVASITSAHDGSLAMTGTGSGVASLAYEVWSETPVVAVPTGPRQQESVDVSPRVRPRRRNANVRAYEADDMECMELLLPFLMVA